MTGARPVVQVANYLALPAKQLCMQMAYGMKHQLMLTCLADETDWGKEGWIGENRK